MIASRRAGTPEPREPWILGTVLGGLVGALLGAVLLAIRELQTMGLVIGAAGLTSVGIGALMSDRTERRPHEPSRERAAPSRWLLLAVAAAQILLLLGLAVLWSTGEHDATSTSVDKRDLALTLATPTLLVAAAALGWRVRRRSSGPRALPIRAVSLVVQWSTVVLAALTVLIAPLLAILIVAFEPIG